MIINERDSITRFGLNDSVVQYLPEVVPRTSFAGVVKIVVQWYIEEGELFRICVNLMT